MNQNMNDNTQTQLFSDTLQQVAVELRQLMDYHNQLVKQLHKEHQLTIPALTH